MLEHGTDAATPVRVPSRRPAALARQLLSATLSAALAALLAGCGDTDEPPAATATSAGSEGRTTRCLDEGVEWRATVTDLTEGAVPSVRIDALDAVGAPWDDPWTVVTTDPSTRERLEEAGDVDTTIGRVVAVDRAPRLLSPGGRCTLYLAPIDAATTRVAIVGDSIAAALVATSADRESLAQDVQARDLGVLVDGQSGAPWADIDGTGGVMLDELRGAASIEDVHVVVVVLGANDGILAAFPNGGEKVAQQQRTDDAIGVGMAIFDDVGCVVVTTPPDHPIRNFALGDDYAREARRVGDVLRALVATDDRLVLADFAELSRSHHLDDDTVGDWFSGDDELHPNVDGVAALRTLVLDAVEQCPAVAPVHRG
jgi:lysophospholipase L1-like esterase